MYSLGMGLPYQNGMTFYNPGAPAPGAAIAAPNDPATLYQAAGVFGTYNKIKNLYSCVGNIESCKDIVFIYSFVQYYFIFLLRTTSYCWTSNICTSNVSSASSISLYATAVSVFSNGCEYHFSHIILFVTPF